MDYEVKLGIGATHNINDLSSKILCSMFWLLIIFPCKISVRNGTCSLLCLLQPY
jgi:hypothetical protein